MSYLTNREAGSLERGEAGPIGRLGMSYLTNREAGSTDRGEAGPIGRLGPRRGVKPDQ